jgi:hypothetical protein
VYTPEKPMGLKRGAEKWVLKIPSGNFNAMNYQGPFSVEWEDSGMEREHGAKI